MLFVNATHCVKVRLASQIRMYSSVAFGPVADIPYIDRQTGKVMTSIPRLMDRVDVEHFKARDCDCERSRDWEGGGKGARSGWAGSLAVGG